MQTRTGIIDLGAFCVELWPKQVSYRISVPMSYISCSRLIISMFHKSHWFVCFCLFYSFSATVKMVVYKNANNKRRAAICPRHFGIWTFWHLTFWPFGIFSISNMSDAENGLIQTAYIHWHTKSPRQKSSRRMRWTALTLTVAFTTNAEGDLPTSLLSKRNIWHWDRNSFADEKWP